MARRIKSLRFNLPFGKDVPSHREHRSKRGRNKINKSDNPAFLLYKKKKEGFLMQNEE
jgi:hypothetical protein